MLLQRRQLCLPGRSPLILEDDGAGTASRLAPSSYIHIAWLPVLFRRSPHHQLALAAAYAGIALSAVVAVFYLLALHKQRFWGYVCMRCLVDTSDVSVTSAVDDRQINLVPAPRQVGVLYCMHIGDIAPAIAIKFANS